jgi:hypothetical protein
MLNPEPPKLRLVLSQLRNDNIAPHAKSITQTRPFRICLQSACDKVQRHPGGGFT